MNKPKVTIIVLQYNNSQDTIRCLNSVKELDYPDYTTTVVDNASDVKDFNNIRFFVESLQNTRFDLISSDKNLGYAGGNNLGVKQALENSADYIFILNPDTTVEQNALTELIEAVKSNPKIGIIGLAIDEGNHTIYGGKIEWLKPELTHINKIHGNFYTTVLKLPRENYIPGACMLIKRDVVKKIGLLDERYLLYFEDADYCVRARNAGYELAITPEIIAKHSVSASTSNLGSALLLRYHFRNAHLFNFKNGPIWVKLVLPFWSVFIIIKQLVKIVFVRSKREISKAILAGVVDFYNNHFGKI